MAKTTIEKITSVEEQIKQLENQRKQLIQQQKEQERKARTHRICKRGGLLESIAPDATPLSDEQFQIFLEKTLISEYARRVLKELKQQNSQAATFRPAGAEQSGGTGVQQTIGNGAGQGD